MEISLEEKEAIKELIDSSNLSLIGDGTMIVKNTTIATTLNYIDKLQKENEEYHRIKKELIRVNKKIYDVDTIDEFIKAIDKLQKENEELKAINSMQKYRIEVIDERELISKVIVRNKMKEYLNKAGVIESIRIARQTTKEEDQEIKLFRTIADVLRELLGGENEQ